MRKASWSQRVMLFEACHAPKVIFQSHGTAGCAQGVGGGDVNKGIDTQECTKSQCPFSTPVSIMLRLSFCVSHQGRKT